VERGQQSQIALANVRFRGKRNSRGKQPANRATDEWACDQDAAGSAVEAACNSVQDAVLNELPSHPGRTEVAA